MKIKTILAAILTAVILLAGTGYVLYSIAPKTISEVESPPKPPRPAMAIKADPESLIQQDSIMACIYTESTNVVRCIPMKQFTDELQRRYDLAHPPHRQPGWMY